MLQYIILQGSWYCSLDVRRIKAKLQPYSFALKVSAGWRQWSSLMHWHTLMGWQPGSCFPGAPQSPPLQSPEPGLGDNFMAKATQLSWETSIRVAVQTTGPNLFSLDPNLFCWPHFISSFPACPTLSILWTLLVTRRRGISLTLTLPAAPRAG